MLSFLFLPPLGMVPGATVGVNAAGRVGAGVGVGVVGAAPTAVAVGKRAVSGKLFAADEFPGQGRGLVGAGVQQAMLLQECQCLRINPVLCFLW